MANVVAPACAAMLLALLGAGCLERAEFDASPEVLAALEECRQSPLATSTFYLGPGLTLRHGMPAAGSAPGNAFSSGFLTNDLGEWRSDPLPDGLWLDGTVQVEVWLRSTGTPAPLMVDPDRPGEGYQLFTQFGSDRSLQPGYAVQFDNAFQLPGTVRHYVQNLTLPPGGFVAEPGDRLRLILTDLALDGPGGSGHDVLYGGDTASRLTFTARCFPSIAWQGEVVEDADIVLRGNQGLLTGAVPQQEGVNVQTVAVTLPINTQRITIRITQHSDVNPVKDDIDLVLTPRGGGEPSYGIGSPYSDEAGTLWVDTLDALFPTGEFDVQVHSYSGLAYEGRLVVSAEHGARLA